MAGFGTFMYENALMAFIPTSFILIMLETSGIKLIQALIFLFTILFVSITIFRMVKLLIENILER